MTNTQPSASADILRDRVDSPADLRERVTSMTAAELAKTIEDMNATRVMPDVFREREVQEAVEKRMEEVDVSLRTKEQWQNLRGDMEKNGITAEAEKKFVEQIEKKGGIRLAIGKAILSILAFLGFKKARALKDSLEQKGYLRTAAESAKEHPIFASFLASLGITAGTEAYRYMEENREAIETSIRKEAEKTGTSVEDAKETIAEKTKDFIKNAANTGLRGLVNGLSFALGGNYDEETGVVTLPHSTLRPPVITAYMAGVRRRSGLPTSGLFSKLVIEDKLSAILRQTGRATDAAVKAMPAKQKAARELLDLMQKGVVPGAATKESLRAEILLETLQDDLNLQEKNAIKTNAVQQAQTDPAAARKRVELLEQELAAFDAKQKPEFEQTKKIIMEELHGHETDLKNGNFKDVGVKKEMAIKGVQEHLQDFQKRSADQKLMLGNRLVESMNDLETRTGQRLDRMASGGKGSRGFEKMTQFAEKAGCMVTRNRVGRFAVGAVAVNSFLPLALEGAAALQMGKEGEAARKAVMVDAAEAGLGFVPGVGEALDIRAAYTGKDLNGRDLTTKQRVVSGAMGALGAASIGLGFFTGGLSIAAFRVFRGTVGAARATSKLVKGAKIAGKADDTVDVIRAAQKEAEVLNTMTNVSKVQKTLIASQKYVHNMQRMAQIAVYADLGVQLWSGVTWVKNSAEELVSDTADKAVQGVDSVSAFISDHLPSSGES